MSRGPILAQLKGVRLSLGGAPLFPPQPDGVMNLGVTDGDGNEIRVVSLKLTHY